MKYNILSAGIPQDQRRDINEISSMLTPVTVACMA
jgi:hypothetical protein